MIARTVSNTIFIPIVAVTILIIIVGSLPYISANPPLPNNAPMLDQLSLQTGIRQFRLNGTIYSWGIALTNEGGAPVIAITATLNMSILADKAHSETALLYVLDSFIIEQETGPPAAILVRSTPPTLVGSSNPLLPNFTATNGLILFSPPPYLKVGETLPLTISITYINGTISVFQTQAPVVSS